MEDDSGNLIASGGLLDQVKTVYFAFEDEYYKILDRINEKVPIYKVVDPIDKFIPSFLLLLLLIFFLLTGFLLLSLGVFFTAPAKFIVVDSSGNPIGAAEVSFSSDGFSTLKITDDYGEFELDYQGENVNVSSEKDKYEPYSDVFPIIEPGKTYTIELDDLAPKIVKVNFELKDSGSKAAISLSVSIWRSRTSFVTSSNKNRSSGLISPFLT